MQLFYDPTITTDNKEFRFDKTESKHIIRVLRKTAGDILHITNGKGWLFSGKISSALASQCIVQIELVEQKPKPWDYYLHMAIAPTKNMDRLEWFIEKATEIGIDEISPIICARSERKVLKKERLEKILEAAMKQSLKFQLPKLNELQTLKSFLKLPQYGQLFMAHCDESDRKSFKNELGKNQKITILIGPEGDFSPEEIKLAIQQKFVPVTFGGNRLRTETAGIVAVQSVAFFNEE
ncbi:MAG: 16S rRNA (uracil(1498)-N(3))-methyltransferase [Flavobacteriaceae bacterium]|jgi:16S rRNA (uracil1498-N3)-methyltransferase|nr:16S rRNA (uracil(1498)-N(3))-methyltransferase [Flavobacteriaceae bacterium]